MSSKRNENESFADYKVRQRNESNKTKRAAKRCRVVYNLWLHDGMPYVKAKHGELD